MSDGAAAHGYTLTEPMSASAGMLAIISNQAALQRMLDFESALARAEAARGVISADAVAPISACCQVAHMDLPALAQAAAAAGNLAIPLVKQLTAAVLQQDADAGKYVHWGATSQDAIDTGLVLQLRDALDLRAPVALVSGPEVDTRYACCQLKGAGAHACIFIRAEQTTQ